MLALHIGYLYLDTGYMYRAVTVLGLRKEHSLESEITMTSLAADVTIDTLAPMNEDTGQYTILAGGEDITHDLRSPAVDTHVSTVSAYSGVRRVLTEKMRTIGHRGRVVMVGRDIGTVVLPDAQMKVFLNASLGERAMRRQHDNQAQGLDLTYEAVRRNLEHRDRIDSRRDAAPLRAAPEAHIIDTTCMEPFEVLSEIMALIAAHSDPL